MSRRLHIAFLALLSAALFPYAIATYNNMGEDAFISFRYVRNFVEGRGLVYNEGEWVEGYSNFSWVMLLAIPARLGGDILLWSKLLGAAAMAGMIWLAGMFFVERKPENGGEGAAAEKAVKAEKINPLLLFAPLAIFFNPHLHYHAGRGLETNFYALVFLGCLFALARARWLVASLGFALLAMTRPEGILHFAGFAAVLALLAAMGGRAARIAAPPAPLRWPSLAAFVAPGAAVLALFIGWRLMTYGQFFPNTVYAKTAPLNFLRNPAARHVLDFAAAWSGLPLLAAAALIFAWNANRDTWKPAIAALGALAVTAYVVLVGQVQAEPFRHFIPMIAPVILLLQAALVSLGRAREPLLRQLAWPALALLLVLNFYTATNGDHPASRLHVRTAQFLTRWDWAARWEWYRHPPIHMFSEAGRWAEANLPPGALLAADQMGQFGYYARNHAIIDLLGLMDRHVAHQGLTWDYIARRNPDFFIVYAENGRPYLENIRALTESSEFTRVYRMEALLVSRYPEKIGNQFAVFGRVVAGTPPAEPRVIPIGATAAEWEKFWRF